MRKVGEARREKGTISIALATCNGSAYLDTQLASFIDQTRTPDQLVVCDDASDDDTFSKLEAFAARAPFEVLLERNAERLGATGNFERAVSRCSGDSIFLADQDDLWLPDKIARLAGVLETRPEMGAVFCNGLVVDRAEASLGYDLWRAQGFGRSEQRAVRRGRAHEVFLRHVVAAGTTLAFRGEYLPLLLPFPALRSAHDAWIAFLVSAVADFAILDEQLIFYRLHESNHFGLRLRGLVEQLAQARVQVEQDAFGYAVSFFEAAKERLQSDAAAAFAVRPLVLAATEQKLEHARRRAALPASRLRRLPTIAADALAGRYRRYSYGWKSAAQDLLLR